MYFSKFTKFVFLSIALTLQARAGPSFPKVTAGDFELIHAATTVSSRSVTDNIPTIGPFVPTAANLIFNTTVPQGGTANIGWIFPSVGNNILAEFDGFAKNITILFTPRATSSWIGPFGPGVNSTDGFCGIYPGYFLEGFLPTSVLGTYQGRWIVEYGESTRPHAPVDPMSGCGPEPFDSKTVEFVRTWEVVAA
ncbi:hypothetical protein B0H12DRAFT_1238358 [Mycena haematopus]|nr:hypothetical protein B0H12DRAFT_1238358 [Mycena haematopus]